MIKINIYFSSCWNIRYCKNFIYSIAFEDTNEDGVLSSLDKTDLYISDLKGNNFKQITKEKNIISFDFFNQFNLGGYPLGFWFAQQGSIYFFVVQIFYYAWRMNNLDIKFDVHED